MPIERKLAAIMFTDIAGYTALSAKDSTKSSELLTTQRDTLKPIVEKHGGSWMKEIGDGLLLTFDSATSAVECSIAIQVATKDIEDLNLRIGIHEGEVIKQDGDVIGDDVNVASRIEPFSAIGGVAITHKIEQAISSNQEFDTKYIGKPKLKGVAQEVKVYCITSHGLPETDVSKVSAKLEEESKFNIFALTGGILTAIGVAFWISVGVFGVSFGGKSEVPSVGILMMENLGKEDEEFWSSGMTADLITKVAGAGLIRVAPLDDILKLDKDLSIEEKAEKLRVKYILTHSFLIKDDSFDLWCKLENIGTGVALFSNKISEPMAMTTQMVGKLANDIITSLKVKANQDLMKTPTNNAEAYEFYLRAKYIYEKRENTDDIEIAQILLNKAIKLDDNLTAARLLLGDSYNRMSKYDKAMEIYSSALKQAEEFGNKRGMVLSLNRMGELGGNNIDYDTAIEYYERALVIAEEMGDKSGMGTSLNGIGNEYRYKGDSEDIALDYYGRSVSIREEIGDKRGMATSLIRIGHMHKFNDDYDTAIEYYERAFTISEEIGDKSGMESAIYSFGDVHYRKGDYDKAIDYYGRSFELEKEMEDKSGIAASLSKIGDVHYRKGDYDKAIDYYGRSLAISEEIGETFGMGLRLFTIGNMHTYKSDYEKALDSYERVLTLLREEEYGNEGSMAWVLSNIGIVHSNKGDYGASLEYLEKSLNIQIELGDVPPEFSIIHETTAYLYIAYKHLGKNYDVNEIYKLVKSKHPETDNIEFALNLRLYELLEDKSYLETAYNQVQEKADKLEHDIAAKFLSYPIPKAIVEEWEKVN